jgi:hypothetical protein
MNIEWLSNTAGRPMRQTGEQHRRNDVPGGFAMTKMRLVQGVVGLSMLALAAAGCGTATGAAVGAGAGAAVGAGTG